jgi:hypothetical protein
VGEPLEGSGKRSLLGRHLERANTPRRMSVQRAV